MLFPPPMKCIVTQCGPFKTEGEVPVTRVHSNAENRPLFPYPTPAPFAGGMQLHTATSCSGGGGDSSATWRRSGGVVARAAMQEWISVDDVLAECAGLVG
jgi:hypothetical protein